MLFTTYTMENYIKQFTSLRTQIEHGRPAPHKAILLMSVIDLVATGKITSPIIQITDDLIERFTLNWKTYVKDDRCENKRLILTPFEYMNSAPFWKSLNKNSAEIDNQLFQFITVEEYRFILRQELIRRYLSTEHRCGVFYSWNILSGLVAIKSCDISVFKYNGSAIPNETKWFWELDSITSGRRKAITLYYLDLPYAAYIELDRYNRARIFWNKELSKLINETRGSEDKDFPLLRFEKKAPDQYKISFLYASQKTYKLQSMEADDQNSSVYEGEAYYSHITKYERSAKNRAIAISLHGVICMACGFDFEKTYGAAGQNYIEVHHIVPLSQQKQRHRINPYTDLICVCSNCHSMIHRDKEHPLSLDELKALINEKSIR